jgi:hypothetical protein
MKSDEDKIKTLSPHLLMAYSGEPGESLLLLTLFWSNPSSRDTREEVADANMAG